MTISIFELQFQMLIIILYGIGFAGGLLAVLALYLSVIMSYIFGFLLLIIGIIAYFYLEGIPFEHQPSQKGKIKYE